jgi:integrase
MAKKELSAVEVNRLLKRPVLGRHRVSNNLYLQVRGENTGSWLYRYMADGRPHHLGLGRADLFTLAEARQRARVCGQQRADKVDPLAAKRQIITAKKIEAAKNVTFGQCAKQYIEAHAPEWKSGPHTAQWHATFEDGRRPALTAVINNLPVGTIDTALAVSMLQEHWTRIPETASRVRQRCEVVIDWAVASQLREAGPNPFAWRGGLKSLLPSPGKLKKLTGAHNHPSLPFLQLPGFMHELRAEQSTPARALEFAILTATRTGEVLNARWKEIDLAAKMWVIPAIRMKSGREHRVPLAGRVLELLAELPVTEGHVFALEGQPLPRLAMLDVMKSMRPGFVPHGFRATFRTWAAERTNYARHVCEAALAHTNGDKTEAAYQRSDLIDPRRSLMELWSEYCLIGVNITHLPVAVVLFEHLSKLSRRSAN